MASFVDVFNRAVFYRKHRPVADRLPEFINRHKTAYHIALLDWREKTLPVWSVQVDATQVRVWTRPNRTGNPHVFALQDQVTLILRPKRR